MNRGTTTVARQLPQEADQGPSDHGRPLVPFDPWTDPWSPPDHSELVRKHALARRRERELARDGHHAPDLEPGETDSVVATTGPTVESVAAPSHPGRYRHLLGAVAAVATAYWYYAIATIVIAIGIPLASGWDASTVLTGSMEPAISPGDVVASAPYGGEPLSPGAIIQFVDPVRAGATVTHRIVTVNEDGSFTTRGDANPTADSAPVPPDQIVGVVRMIAPNAGLPQVWWTTHDHMRLVGWIVLTAGAIMIMAVHTNSERRAGERRTGRQGSAILRPAMVLGLVAAVVGVGTAAWSQARFVAGADAPASTFEAATAFNSIDHVGPLGVVACTPGAQSTITLTGPVAAGNTIVIRFALRDLRGGNGYAATDTAGNPYIVDGIASDNVRTEAAIVSAHIATALEPGDQITLSHPNGRAVVVAYDVFAGISATDRVVAITTGTGNDRTPSLTLTLPEAPALVIGHVAVRDAVTVDLPTQGWNPLDSGAVTCDRDLTHRSAWTQQNLTADVTYSPTFDAKNRWSGLVVAYRAG